MPIAHVSQLGSSPRCTPCSLPWRTYAHEGRRGWVALFVDGGPSWWRWSAMPRIAFAGWRLWAVRARHALSSARPPRRSGPVPRVPVRLGAERDRFQHPARGPAVHAAHCNSSRQLRRFPLQGGRSYGAGTTAIAGGAGGRWIPTPSWMCGTFGFESVFGGRLGHRSRQWDPIRRGRTTRPTPRWTVTVPSMSVRRWISSTPFWW